MLRLIRQVYNYYFSEDRDFTKRLYTIIGFIPSNISIFKLAFAHKSSSGTEEFEFYGVQNNERLEYLGDAVLGTIVAEYLFKKYPNKDEGFLTKMRSKIVNRKMMNEIGEQMGLDLFLMHYQNQNKLSRTMLGNALEALIGSIYIDVGYYRTQDFIIDYLLRDYLSVEYLEEYDDNYKSQLLEWCQKNRKDINYKVISKSKKDNRDFFKVVVIISGNEMAIAEDFNKKSAQQMASKIALGKLGIS